MAKFLIGVLAGIALMRYLSDGVLTDDQKAQIEQNASGLFQTVESTVAQKLSSSSQ